MVIGQLLIEIPADTCRQAKGKVLIEGPFEVELDTALVVRRGIERVECQAEPARDFRSRLLTEESIGPLMSRAGRFRPVCTNRLES